jgi:hypothetical protein
MKKLSFLFLLIIYALLTNAQSDKISGDWLLIKAEVDGNAKEIYNNANFSEDNTLLISGIPVCTWEYKKNDNVISMVSEMDEDFNGDWEVITLNEEELITKKEAVTLYYSKINQKKIEEANLASGLIGVWKYTNEMGSTNMLKIEAPNTYILRSIMDGSTSTAQGEWMYKPSDQCVIFTGFAREIRGKNQIITLNTEELVFNHNGTTITASIESTEASKIERLNFSYEDFDEESTSESTIPWMWTSLEDMVAFLSKHEYLKYKDGSLIEGFDSFNYTSILLTIEANVDENYIMFTNLQLIEGDSLQYGQDNKDSMSESYNDFFPQEEPEVYKIVDSETITVMAGTFDCTVVEGIANEAKVKFWMINDMPGVYAKIIREGESHFGDLEYHIIELEEVK